MKIGKKTMKRGGTAWKLGIASQDLALGNPALKKQGMLEEHVDVEVDALIKVPDDIVLAELGIDSKRSDDMLTIVIPDSIVNSIDLFTNGGSKRKSKKSKKTKKGRGAHEGGKKKCPKHCRRKTRRTRKGLKQRKN